MNRRRLLQGLSLGVVSAKLSGALPSLAQTAYTEPKPSRPIAANDHVSVGVIGVGSRGRELTRQLLRTPGVDVTAVCDVYKPRFAQIDDLAGRKVPAYTDYRQLLARSDIDAVFIATPPVFHAKYAIAAMNSGRAVYGEKTLGFTADDCTNVVNAVQRTGQVFQIGHQMRYASWIQEAVKRVHRGDIGEPLQVYGYWHRNDDWRRTVPDPRLEHLINWRLYRESSGGLFEELGSHHIDIANWVFKAQPQDVVGTTSIAKYHDGRTVGDNVQVILGYSGGRRMFFSSILDNAFAADQLWIYCTEGSLQITLEDATFYSKTRKEITAASHSDIVEHGVATGASYNPNSAMPYRGPGDRIHSKKGEVPTLTACKSFIQCVRDRKRPFADVDAGFGSGMPVAIGTPILREGPSTRIPQLKGLAHS